MAQGQQSKLLLYLIMLLGLIMGYIFSAGTDPAAAVPALDPAFGLSAVQSLKSVRVDSSILTEETFTSLRIFGSLPVKAEAGGKSNPFQ